jgi:hypothetical protein
MQEWFNLTRDDVLRLHMTPLLVSFWSVGLYDFSPEYGDSMFLRNVGVDLRDYTAPKPKTASVSNCMKIRKILTINVVSK